MTDVSVGVRACSKILLVDRDRGSVDVLGFLVRQGGLAPVTACEPMTALELYEKERPGFAIIELNLQPWDGLELLADLRKRSSSMVIMVLTSESSEDVKVRALESGADDYVIKPCGHRELMARLRAHARRAVASSELPGPTAVLEVGPLRLDPVERVVVIAGQTLRLSGTEARLLHYLMRNRDSVVSTEALARDVWGNDDAAAREVVRVTVHRLRRKLGDLGPQRFIHTVPGVGLKLRTSAISRDIARAHL